MKPRSEGPYPQLFALGAAAILMAVLAPDSAVAQAWPAKPVRVIVPFGTGGGTDIQARILADVLRRNTGQNFITDNRAGASGLIGAELVVNAPPDGYTILFSTATLAVNTTLYGKSMKFDPRTDLVASTWVSSTPLVLVVHPSVPAQSVNELIALAKRLPGKLNNGVNVPGSTSHLAGEMFQQLTKTKAAIIPFKGGGPAIQGLMTGDIDFLFATGPVAAAARKTGRVRALAVTTAKKASAFPDLPTINTFVPGLVADNWYAMFFPKGTPPAIVNALSALMKKTLADPKIAAFYKQEGLDAVGSTPEELKKNLEEEIVKYAKVIKDGHIPLR
jgi:tripartite-type tricarboxylate transporter receptor subunit TctC